MNPDVHCFVGFVADFPAVRTNDGPPGRELAAFVADVYKRAGFGPGEPADVDYAWELWPDVDGFAIRTMIGFVGDTDSDPPRQWLITNDLPVGFLQRLLKTKAVHSKTAALKRLAQVLHQAIELDSRFSHVYWYNPNTFDMPGDVPQSSPDA